jgi:hypothetical protein
MATGETPAYASVSQSRLSFRNALRSISPSTCYPVGSGVTRQAMSTFLYKSN